MFDPFSDPLAGYNTLYVFVHTGSTFPPHIFGDMTVNIQGEGRGVVAKVFLPMYFTPSPSKVCGVHFSFRYVYTILSI